MPATAASLGVADVTAVLSSFGSPAMLDPPKHFPLDPTVRNNATVATQSAVLILMFFSYA
jgi:hypothetical protein